MSAAPDPADDPSAWDDEWNRDAWYELGVADREHRNADSWTAWVLRLVAIGLALPIVMGVLVYLLILAF